ncbi:MAG TPA: NAD-binding protein [Bryobacteraceae bacterium]|nr:NAD-binding protein [Bryobacteraceae bacterium]
MTGSGSESGSAARGNLPLRRRLASLWPHWPLAILLAAIGILNTLDGLNLRMAMLQRVHTLNSLGESLAAVGNTAQVILGLMLVGAGIGLLRRLSIAWTLAVLLLMITVAIGVARAQWGVSLVVRTVILCALFVYRHEFTRRTALSSLLFSMSNILAILAYGVFGSYLLGNGFSPPIHDLNVAFYFTITTLSTVGFGDIVPATTETRWFVVSMLVMGLGVFAGAIASAVGPKISGEFERLFNPKEKAMELKDHVILVGQGSIARNTAEELNKRGAKFVQVVLSKATADTPAEHTIEGDPSSDTVLRQAGIENARMVIAAREDDGENAFIVLAAKDLNPNMRVLAVASSALAIRRLRLARADLVFSPAAVGSRLLADLVEGNEIMPEFQDLLEGHPKGA